MASERARKDTNMEVVILCGGLGTRLREETEFRPKPMVNIGPRPILWHIMKTFASHGHTDFVRPGLQGRDDQGLFPQLRSDEQRRDH
jgi:dTDP-glucose pyrophosphorylase